VISHEKYIKEGKVHFHLGFKSKILPRSLTALNAWVSFSEITPQSKIFQISKLIFDSLLWA
jgi:hypothetical protein